MGMDLRLHVQHLCDTGMEMRMTFRIHAMFNTLRSQVG